MELYHLISPCLKLTLISVSLDNMHEIVGVSDVNVYVEEAMTIHW